MDVCFELQGKGFSVNAAYYATRKIKTQACRDWETDKLHQLDEVKDLVDLTDTWREQGGSFEVHLVHEYPYHVFYNKQGLISSKTFDCSNVEKLLIDLIFGRTMGVDDKNITKLISEKRVGAQHCIKVKIQLIR